MLESQSTKKYVYNARRNWWRRPTTKEAPLCNPAYTGWFPNCGTV